MSTTTQPQPNNGVALDPVPIVRSNNIGWLCVHAKRAVVVLQQFNTVVRIKFPALSTACRIALSTAGCRATAASFIARSWRRFWVRTWLFVSWRRFALRGAFFLLFLWLFWNLRCRRLDGFWIGDFWGRYRLIDGLWFWGVINSRSISSPHHGAGAQSPRLGCLAHRHVHWRLLEFGRNRVLIGFVLQSLDSGVFLFDFGGINRFDRIATHDGPDKVESDRADGKRHADPFQYSPAPSARLAHNSY